MNARELEVLNRRNRMTPEERDIDIVRETLGPLFAAFFGPPSPSPEPESEANDQE